MKKNPITLITPLALALSAFLFYIPSLYYAFQFDDLANIVKFYDIRHKTIRDLAFSNTRWISYWLNTLHYKVAKFDPFYYRLSNVLFHCITGMLVFAFIYMGLTRLKKESFFSKNAYLLASVTAGLFLLHPVQTQTVSYVIQGQLEGLAGLAIMGIMCCFLLLTKVSSIVQKIVFFLIFILGCALATGTKEIAIIIPILLLVVDWFFVAQGDKKSLISRWWIHATAWLIIGSIYIYFLKPDYFMRVFGLAIETQNNIGNVLTENPHAKITSLWYLMSQFKVMVHYLTIFFWPFFISVDYDWLLVRGFFAPDCFFPFLLLCIVSYILVRILRKNPIDLIGFGLVWFFVTILPRSSIIPSTELVADYKTYTASIGILFAIASGCVALIEYTQTKIRIKIFSQQLQFALYALFLLPFGGLTVLRNTVWRSGEEFWWNIIQNAPNKARAYNNYGVSLSEQNRHNEAISYFKKAISMDRYYPDPCNNLAVAQSAIGNIDAAIEAMEQGIKIQPYYPEGYNNLASFLLQKKEYERAEKSLKKAISLRPHYGKAYFNLGRLYMELEKRELAFESFKNCCMKADFDNDVGFSSYGMISLMLQKADDALYAYKRLIEINPKDFNAHINLANAYFIKKEFQQAETIYKRLLPHAPGDAKLKFNLGETYFSQEKYTEALELFKNISENHSELPQVYIRMAACYAKTGNILQAQKELHLILARNNIPENIKKNAQFALAQITSKTKITA